MASNHCIVQRKKVDSMSFPACGLQAFLTLHALAAHAIVPRFALALIPAVEPLAVARDPEGSLLRICQDRDAVVSGVNAVFRALAAVVP